MLAVICKVDLTKWGSSVLGFCVGGAHGKNVQPNHSRGKLAAQGIQILFSLHQSETHTVTHEDSNSAGPGIIGGQRGCLHFRRLHLV